MKIKKIISQSRRDFRAIYECDHDDCDHEEEGPGYDDDHFHTNVVPDMVCEKCKRKASSVGFRALRTKYPEGMSV